MGKGKHLVTIRTAVQACENGKGTVSVRDTRGRTIAVTLLPETEVRGKNLAILESNYRLGSPATIAIGEETKVGQIVYFRACASIEGDFLKVGKGHITESVTSKEGIRYYRMFSNVDPIFCLAGAFTGAALFNEDTELIGINEALWASPLFQTKDGIIETKKYERPGRDYWVIQGRELIGELERLGIPYHVADGQTPKSEPSVTADSVVTILHHPTTMILVYVGGILFGLFTLAFAFMRGAKDIQRVAYHLGILKNKEKEDEKTPLPASGFAVESEGRITESVDLRDVVSETIRRPNYLSLAEAVEAESYGTIEQHAYTAEACEDVDLMYDNVAQALSLTDVMARHASTRELECAKFAVSEAKGSFQDLQKKYNVEVAPALTEVITTLKPWIETLKTQQGQAPQMPSR